MTVALFLTILLASLATVGLGAGLLRIFGFGALPGTLKLGAGYGLGVVAIAKFLHLSSFAGITLDAAGWIAVSLGLVAAGWETRQRFLVRGSTFFPLRQLSYQRLSATFGTWKRDPLIVALLILLAAHLAITLTNNFLRPIFPWDAFTTWMYRAKAWALQNSITPMVSVNDWITTGGQSGYALYASHYPTALSIYAAFMSALVGGWQPAAASVPWSLCLLALCMTAHGLLTLAGVGNRRALVGAYLLGSMPLLNIHAALAGYGDLWMALYAGSGLAALLIWGMSGRTAALWLAVLLLLAGTQIKTEGWLWLGLGLGFVMLEWAASRIGYLKLFASLLVVAGVIWGLGITSLTLGPLGQWGFDETHLYAGALGSYALRPFNPAGSYWSILFEQGNFLLLASFYLLALALISIKVRRRATSFWLMGLLIAGSQLIIFGLSSYSLYAETGTAIARLFLHFTPVAAVSIILSWVASEQRNGVNARQTAQSDHRQALKFCWPRLTSSSALVVLALIAPLCLLVFQAPPTVQATSEQMIAVVGETESTTLGRQFIESPINVGVLKAPGTMPREPMHYLRTDATIPNAESASFYWINEGETQVNSMPLTLAGDSLIDLNQYAAWRTANKRELGFLIKTSEFEHTYFRDFSLGSGIGIAALPSLFNQWTAKETLTQKTVNNTLGHHESPVSLTAWLTIGVVLLAAVFGTVLCAQHTKLLGGVLGSAVLFLWALAGTVTLIQTSLLDCLTPESQCLTAAGDDPHAGALTGLAKKISTNTAPKTPILIVDNGSPLSAQKLPMLLLPRRAVQANQTDTSLMVDWDGATVLVGAESETLNQMADKLLSLQPSREMIKLGDSVILIGSNP